MSDTGTARPRPKRTNKRVDRRARPRATSEWADTAVPTSVRWALANERFARRRFTPFQWAILRIRNPRCECGEFHQGRSTSTFVGRVLGMTGRSKEVREAELAAERTAAELCYEWLPAYRKWQHGERLTADERRILAKHKRAKKGRREQEDPGYLVQHEDVLEAHHTLARRFTDIAPGWAGRDATSEDRERLERHLDND